ncbi:MAG: hypothetical protein Roseis2KO_47960 [Roseivirga sp.]
MKILLVSFFLILPGLAIVAQERYPIDQIAYNKLQEAFSNADMINAEKEAYNRWDQLLNIVYGEAEKQMQPATYSALRESQRAWLKYRDEELKVINRLYYAELQGTMWYAPAAAARKRLVRKRVLTILDQLSLLTMQTEEETPDIIGKWVSTRTDDKTTILEIREDYTLVWSDQSTDRYDIAFYSMSGECPNSSTKEDENIITLIKPGTTPEKCCYFLRFDSTSLELRTTDGTTSSWSRR